MVESGRSAMSGGAGERWPTPSGDPAGFQPPAGSPPPSRPPPPPASAPTPPPLGPRRHPSDGDSGSRARDVLLVVAGVVVNLVLVVAIVLVVNRSGDDDEGTTTGGEETGGGEATGAGEGTGGEEDPDGDGGDGGDDGGDGEGAGDGEDTDEVAPADLTVDELEAVLATDTDLGEDYRQYGDSQEQPANQQDAFRENANLSPACLEAYDYFRQAEGQGRGRWVHFLRNQPRHLISQGVFLVEEGDRSGAEAAETYTSECSGASFRQPPYGRVRAESVTEPLDGPGDEAVVLVETTSVSRPVRYSYDSYSVIVARDGVVVYTAMADAVGSDYETTPADQDLVRSLAQTSDERLVELLGE